MLKRNIGNELSYTSTNYCKYLYTLVEEPWLQSEFHICGCFLAGYIHTHTAIMNSGFGLQYSSVHQTLLQLDRGNEKEITASVSVVFISMNKLQTHWYGDILVQHYTQLQQQGGAGLHGAQTLSSWLQSDSFIYWHFLNCRSKRPFIDGDLKTMWNRVWSIPLFGKRNLNWGQLHFALTIVPETILVWSNTADFYTATFGLLAAVTTKFHTLNAVVAWNPRRHCKMFLEKNSLEVFLFFSKPVT